MLDVRHTSHSGLLKSHLLERINSLVNLLRRCAFVLGASLARSVEEWTALSSEADCPLVTSSTALHRNLLRDLTQKKAHVARF